MRIPRNSHFRLFPDDLEEMQPCCQCRTAKLIISKTLWATFLGRASGPASQIPHLSAICYRAPLPSVQTSAALLE